MSNFSNTNTLLFKLRVKSKNNFFRKFWNKKITSEHEMVSIYTKMHNIANKLFSAWSEVFSLKINKVCRFVHSWWTTCAFCMQCVVCDVRRWTLVCMCSFNWILYGFHFDRQQIEWLFVIQWITLRTVKKNWI